MPEDMESKLDAWSKALDELNAERDRLIIDAFHAFKGNKARIGEWSGVSRTTIYKVLEIHDIDPQMYSKRDKEEKR